MWVLRRREVAEAFHSGHLCTLDLVRCGLGHVGRGGPVVDAGQEVDGARVCVDVCDAVACIKAAEIEVEIAMEDA